MSATDHQLVCRCTSPGRGGGEEGSEADETDWQGVKLRICLCEGVIRDTLRCRVILHEYVIGVASIQTARLGLRFLCEMWV